jgi:CubicO group peptidase (beta-lactamase class C family)
MFQQHGHAIGLALSAALLIWSLPAGASAQPAIEPPSAAEIAPILAQAKAPSVSIAWIVDGRIVARAYGEQSPGVPATPASLYNIASMTKPLTAEVILRLAARQRLSLDEPMSPTWIDPDLAGDPRAKLLTPRLALSHRTGLPNWRAKTGLAFERAPGQAYGYSGEGYVYVAHFAEARTGEPLDRLAAELVFTPLGMHDTSYVGQPWFSGRIAAPTDADGKPLAPHIAAHAVAADLVYSTPSDYARFMLAVTRDDALTPGLAAERLQPASDTRAEWCPKAAPPCPDSLGFGLGWEVARFGPRTYLMHTGRDEGVFTLGYIRPDTLSGLVIFTNSDNGGAMMLPLLERFGADAEFLAYLKARAG